MTVPLTTWLSITVLEGKDIIYNAVNALVYRVDWPTISFYISKNKKPKVVTDVF